MDRKRRAEPFRNGRNQAVRIPRKFELPGDEVMIRKDGSRQIIAPVQKGSLFELPVTLRPLTEEFSLAPTRRKSDGSRLDSNIVSDPIRNPTGQLMQHIRDVGEEQDCKSVIVAANLRHGLKRWDWRG